MQVRLGRSEDNVNTIVRFRTEFLARSAAATGPNDVYPLPYAFYLFVFDDGAAEPTGMAEFFFYDQAFDHYDDCPYREARDTVRIAPMEQVVHVRSLVVQQHHKQDALRRSLCESMASIGSELGARYMSADAGIGVAQLQTAKLDVGASQRQGLQHVETTLSILAFDLDARRAPAAEQLDVALIDMLLAQTIRRRGRRALDDAVKPGPRLDKLLPAHWVGVWQRQLRVYAC
jgi:hypothetical protein